MRLSQSQKMRLSQKKRLSTACRAAREIEMGDFQALAPSVLVFRLMKIPTLWNKR
jgi:hypothetical protein